MMDHIWKFIGGLCICILFVAMVGGFTAAKFGENTAITVIFIFLLILGSYGAGSILQQIAKYQTIKMLKELDE